MIILEDDPYRDIRYSGTDLKPIKAFDQTGHTVLANSFSKIFSPGARLGYVFAGDEVTSKLFDAKTATNSHTSMLPQVICPPSFSSAGLPGPPPDDLRPLPGEKGHDDRVHRPLLPARDKADLPGRGLFTWAELPGGSTRPTCLPRPPRIRR